MQHFTNREVTGSKVAGAANAGGEVDPDVVETTMKKREARRAPILKNYRNVYGGKV